MGEVAVNEGERPGAGSTTCFTGKGNLAPPHAGRTIKCFILTFHQKKQAAQQQRGKGENMHGSPHDVDLRPYSYYVTRKGQRRLRGLVCVAATSVLWFLAAVGVALMVDPVHGWFSDASEGSSSSSSSSSSSGSVKAPAGGGVHLHAFEDTPAVVAYLCLVFGAPLLCVCLVVWCTRPHGRSRSAQPRRTTAKEAAVAFFACRCCCPNRGEGNQRSARMFLPCQDVGGHQEAATVDAWLPSGICPLTSGENDDDDSLSSVSAYPAELQAMAEDPEEWPVS